MGTVAGGHQNLLTRLSCKEAAKYYKAGFWRNDTIYQRAAGHAHRAPERVAIRDNLATLTYGELLDLADRFAEDFRGAGLRPGDRVGAWMSSRVETAALLLACSRDGLVLCPSLHRNHTVDEVTDLLKRCTARILVGETGYGADGDRHDIFSRAASCAHMRRVYKLSRPEKRTGRSIATELGLKTRATFPEIGAADDVTYLPYTSGTTGEPKGVMHSNNTLLANARAIARDWSFGEHSVAYTLSPLSHNLGFGALVLTMHVGGEIVLHDLRRSASLLSRLRQTRATFLFGVPAHAVDLLREIEEAGVPNITDLRGFRISGAAAAPSVIAKLLSYGIVPQSGYGMTEAGSHHYTLPADDPNLIINTSGRACEGYELRVFSAENPDHEVPTGEVGHIGGRGASLMLGYFDDQTGTEQSFNGDGWFMTGDLGRVDSRGYLQITGRIKDIIIRGGHNIHPARIEELAMRFPHVERAAAIPVKDERLGERVCIVVMSKPSKKVDPQQLLTHLHKQGLSKYDMPEYFLQVDEIPLGASGKMLKRALLPFIAEGKFSPVPIRFQDSDR